MSAELLHEGKCTTQPCLGCKMSCCTFKDIENMC